MISALLTSGLAIFQGWLGHKQELKAIDRQAIINRKKAEAEAAGKLDVSSRNQITWEDNYLILLFTLPLILLFISPMLALFWPAASLIIPAVMSGFEALKETPRAYQMGMGLIFVYVFGFRRLLHKIIDSGMGRLWKGG